MLLSRYFLTGKGKHISGLAYELQRMKQIEIIKNNLK